MVPLRVTVRIVPMNLEIQETETPNKLIISIGKNKVDWLYSRELLKNLRKIFVDGIGKLLKCKLPRK